MAKRHNRRQRKKLHLGEFQEFGFTASARFTLEPSVDQLDALLDSFLEFVEANGMMTAASTSDKFDAYLISSAARGSPTEDHRQLVRQWLDGRSELAGIEVGELSDAWHPVEK
ncbi:YggL family protein [Paraburkholderia pallida]|uniref:DUF469 family protein n=1 Tax=Paraburkholderia pallida TaxID=2547399 RepID=A0A4P7CN05_9BURK|nr:YggL family protein [Paraburkholderia pallida]QBQ96287.1 DUF469 family protein [Paraburkholderia pallida]